MQGISYSLLAWIQLLFTTTGDFQRNESPAENILQPFRSEEGNTSLTVISQPQQNPLIHKGAHYDENTECSFPGSSSINTDPSFRQQSFRHETQVDNKHLEGPLSTPLVDKERHVADSSANTKKHLNNLGQTLQNTSVLESSSSLKTNTSKSLNNQGQTLQNTSVLESCSDPKEHGHAANIMNDRKGYLLDKWGEPRDITEMQQLNDSSQMPITESEYHQMSPTETVNENTRIRLLQFSGAQSLAEPERDIAQPVKKPTTFTNEEIFQPTYPMTNSHEKEIIPENQYFIHDVSDIHFNSKEHSPLQHHVDIYNPQGPNDYSYKYLSTPLITNQPNLLNKTVDTIGHGNISSGSLTLTEQTSSSLSSSTEQGVSHSNQVQPEQNMVSQGVSHLNEVQPEQNIVSHSNVQPPEQNMVSRVDQHSDEKEDPWNNLTEESILPREKHKLNIKNISESYSFPEMDDQAIDQQFLDDPNSKKFKFPLKLEKNINEKDSERRNQNNGVSDNKHLNINNQEYGPLNRVSEITTYTIPPDNISVETKHYEQNKRKCMDEEEYSNETGGHSNETIENSGYQLGLSSPLSVKEDHSNGISHQLSVTEDHSNGIPPQQIQTIEDKNNLHKPYPSTLPRIEHPLFDKSIGREKYIRNILNSRDSQILRDKQMVPLLSYEEFKKQKHTLTDRIKGLKEKQSIIKENKIQDSPIRLLSYDEFMEEDGNQEHPSKNITDQMDTLMFYDQEDSDCDRGSLTTVTDGLLYLLPIVQNSLNTGRLNTGNQNILDAVNQNILNTSRMNQNILNTSRTNQNISNTGSFNTSDKNIEDMRHSHTQTSSNRRDMENIHRETIKNKHLYIPVGTNTDQGNTSEGYNSTEYEVIYEKTPLNQENKMRGTRAFTVSLEILTTPQKYDHKKEQTLNSSDDYPSTEQSDDYSSANFYNKLEGHFYNKEKSNISDHLVTPPDQLISKGDLRTPPDQLISTRYFSISPDQLISKGDFSTPLNEELISKGDLSIPPDQFGSELTDNFNSSSNDQLSSELVTFLETPLDYSTRKGDIPYFHDVIGVIDKGTDNIEQMTQQSFYRIYEKIKEIIYNPDNVIEEIIRQSNQSFYTTASSLFRKTGTELITLIKRTTNQEYKEICVNIKSLNYDLCDTLIVILRNLFCTLRNINTLKYIDEPIRQANEEVMEQIRNMIGMSRGRIKGLIKQGYTKKGPIMQGYTKKGLISKDDITKRGPLDEDITDYSRRRVTDLNHKINSSSIGNTHFNTLMDTGRIRKIIKEEFNERRKRGSEYINRHGITYKGDMDQKGNKKYFNCSDHESHSGKVNYLNNENHPNHENYLNKVNHPNHVSHTDQVNYSNKVNHPKEPLSDNLNYPDNVKYESKSHIDLIIWPDPQDVAHKVGESIKKGYMNEYKDAVTIEWENMMDQLEHITRIAMKETSKTVKNETIFFIDGIKEIIIDLLEEWKYQIEYKTSNDIRKVSDHIMDKQYKDEKKILNLLNKYKREYKRIVKNTTGQEVQEIEKEIEKYNWEVVEAVLPPKLEKKIEEIKNRGRRK